MAKVMNSIPNYFEQVYTGVLGKVIGVYMGRPFEGWTRDAIEKRWGNVDHYVHHDQNVPLVVADDDISGTSPSYAPLRIPASASTPQPTSSATPGSTTSLSAARFFGGAALDIRPSTPPIRV